MKQASTQHSVVLAREARRGAWDMITSSGGQALGTHTARPSFERPDWQELVSRPAMSVCATESDSSIPACAVDTRTQEPAAVGARARRHRGVTRDKLLMLSLGALLGEGCPEMMLRALELR